MGFGVNGKHHPADFTEDGRNLDDFVGEVHRRDGVVEVKKPERRWRVIPYDEVSRRLQARPKK